MLPFQLIYTKLIDQINWFSTLCTKKRVQRICGTTLTYTEAKLKSLHFW